LGAVMLICTNAVVTICFVAEGLIKWLENIEKWKLSCKKKISHNIVQKNKNNLKNISKNPNLPIT
jgi:hypothetical protein